MIKIIKKGKTGLWRIVKQITQNQPEKHTSGKIARLVHWFPFFNRQPILHP